MTISELYYAEKLLKQKNISPDLLKSKNIEIDNIKNNFMNLFNDNNNEINTNLTFDMLTDLLMTDDIYVNTNILTTLVNFGNLIKTRSTCWLWDILILVASSKIKAEFPTYNKNSLEQRKQVNLKLRSYFEQIKPILQKINKDNMINFFNKSLEITSDNFTKSFEMAKINNDPNQSLIEKELDTMIPEKIGPLKCFFVDLIQYYYSTDILHPIIWAQILRDIFINFLKNPPLSENELFQFFSKHLLLNSGPFILKILQQVRPIMSEEQRKTYNLTKLTYPKMTESQYKLILSKIIINWDMYKILNDASASVGHVFFLQHIITLDKFVVKVVKPMSIIQSCYEYSKLNTFFEKNSLEQRFVHNMLYSTGKEMQSKNEIENINRGNKLYSINYNELFNDVDINASITTIKVKENIVIDNCWFALTMTIAPGIPLSSLLESNGKNILSLDTPYRAYLHRCFDLLVYKFFSNIISNGFYHGDLHAGNVYFSYTDKPERKAQLTLIDFGSVGTIDIFNDDPDINQLIKIIIQSSFFNYNELLDTLTDLLNKKTMNLIDKNSDNYINFRKDLKKIKIKNIYNNKKNPNMEESFNKTCLINKKRLGKEESFNNNLTKNEKKEEPTQSLHAKCYYTSQKSGKSINNENSEKMMDSLYDYIDNNKEDKITKDFENIEPLPSYDCNVDKSTNIISFTEIMNMIMEFYSRSNVNVPITIPELYELFKAYILINGLSSQINYDPLRMSVIIGKILYKYDYILNVVKHPLIVLKMYNIYDIENKKFKRYNEIIEKLEEGKYNLDEIKKI